jgi:hypothetical protein
MTDLDLFSADDAPTFEPAEIVQGNFVIWKRKIAIDETLFTVTYEIGGVVVSTGTVDGDYWVFEMDGATTTAFSTGENRWSLVVTRDADNEKVEGATGTWTVFATTGDRRTHAEIMLTQIEALLANRALADVESYSIKGRSLTKLSLNELMRWRDYYRSEVASADGNSSTFDGAPKNTLRVRWLP